MAKKNNILPGIAVCILFILLFSSFAAAADNEQFDPNTFDYQNGDYGSITDWSKVDWSKVNWNQDSVYSNANLDFENIPPEYAGKIDARKVISAGRGKELTVEQIAGNFEEIDDLAAGVDSSSATEAIKQKYGLQVISLGPSANIHNGILSTKDKPGTSGTQKGSLDLSGKSDWQVSVESDGTITVLSPDKMSEKIISNNDHFTMESKATYVTKNGQEIGIEKISFRGKQAYIRGGSTANLDTDGDFEDDFEIPAKKDLNIYFEQPQKPLGNYIIINKGDIAIKDGQIKKEMTELGLYSEGKEGITRMQAYSKDEEIVIIPKPGNKLFNMVKRQYGTDPENPVSLVPDERDTLKITVTPGAKLDIMSRLEQGKVPLMTQSEKGEVKIETGRMKVRLSEGKIMVTPPEPFSKNDKDSKMIDTRNSVPFELTTTNVPGEGEALRVSSSNRFVHYDNEKITTMMVTGASNKIEPNMMKTLADLEHKHPQMKFRIVKEQIERLYTHPDYNEITPNMAQLMDSFVSQGGVETFVKEIQFGSHSNAFGGSGDPRNFNPIMNFGERTLDPATLMQRPLRDVSPDQIIRHEFDHILDAHITNAELSQMKVGEERKGLADFYQDEVDKTYDRLAGDPVFKKMITEAESKGIPKKTTEATAPSDMLNSKLYAIKAGAQMQNPPWSEEKTKRRQVQTVIDFLATEENNARKQGATETEKVVQLKGDLKKATGLYPYSFQEEEVKNPKNPRYFELASTYSEVGGEDARKEPNLARLNYDRALALSQLYNFKKGDPEYQIVDVAAYKCRVATGSECQPCSVYNTFTCKK